MSEKASVKVFKYIENMILSKRWKKNEKITSEIALAKELEVSRISVREAIGSLETLNILERKKGGGTYVKQVTPSHYLEQLIPFLVVGDINYLEILETRIGLDVESAILFAERATKEEVEKLETILREMKKNIKNPEIFLEKDAEFHRHIGECSQNKILGKIINILFDVTTYYAKSEYHSLNYEDRIEEHQNIYEAIKRKDTELIKLFSKRHINRTIDSLKEKN